MKKLDWKKELKQFYFPKPGTPGFVKVPPLKCLMIDGAGDPNNSVSFHDAVAALYAVSYAIKYAVKKAKGGVDFAVMPLEGLWWMEDDAPFDWEARDRWRWTLLIGQPALVTKTMVNAAIKTAAGKKPNPSLSGIRFGTLKEGTAAQIMHIGPFAEEGPSIAAMHALVEKSGYALTGRHHEVYLSDFKKTKPEKLRTLLRHPVLKKK